MGIKYGSIQEQIGGTYTRNDSSDDVKEESNSPDGRSRAKVKADDDYTIRE